MICIRVDIVFIMLACDIPEQFIKVPLNLAVMLSANIMEISGRLKVSFKVLVILNMVAFIITGVVL